MLTSLQLLSYVAQTERDFIRQLQAEGIAAAMARGVHFGRSPKERPAIFSVLREQWFARVKSLRGRLLVNSTSLIQPSCAGVMLDKAHIIEHPVSGRLNKIITAEIASCKRFISSVDCKFYLKFALDNVYLVHQ